MMKKEEKMERVMEKREEEEGDWVLLVWESCLGGCVGLGGGEEGGIRSDFWLERVASRAS